MNFTAKYDGGYCYECGLPLEAGDLLKYDKSDRLNHAECVEVAVPDQPALFDLEQARELQKH